MAECLGDELRADGEALPMRPFAADQIRARFTSFAEEVLGLFQPVPSGIGDDD